MANFFNMIMDWFRFLFGKSGADIDMGIVETTSGETGNEEPEVNVVEPEEGEGDSAGSTEVNVIEPPVEPVQKTYKYTILLDNGHASSTPGKRSPKEDGMEQFFEYEFNRDIVKRIARELDKIGIRYEILVPEMSTDVPLTTRAERANNFCKEYGNENCIFLSIHANAAGKGDRWMIAKGWSCYTSKGETASDPYAEIFMREAEKVLVPLGRTIRKYSQKKYSWEDNFTVLVKTKCPAILTENLFYDNKDEVKFLQSEEGREAIAQIHINAILKIENPD